MEFKYRYSGQSAVTNDAQNTSVSFSPDTLRPPTFFVGTIQQSLAFREAISALHDVVISNMNYQPKDRSDYEQWLANEEQRLLAEMLSSQGNIEKDVAAISARLRDINKQSDSVLGDYYKAQQRYFDYLYKADLDAWYVLDPVITVHPDEIFFECFSEDESSYGKLSCGYDVFKQISDTEYGTTNIDYSQGLYDEFQKIREYRETSLAIDPDGFKVQTGSAPQFEEKKIDLPDSWVRGFLQVSSAMTLPAVTLALQPMDIHNICYALRRKRERVGPRAMRFDLVPGQPAKVTFEPWNYTITLARSLYQGDETRSIRVWGRRRIHLLERLIPIAKGFTLHLLGDGLPSFYVADLGAMSFTLGLSGWSANDWSTLGNFDLLAPRADVDALTLRRVYEALAETWQESSRSLAQRLQLDETLVKSALAVYSQQGLVLFDLASQVYRVRELSREPLPVDQLRFVNERDEKAQRFLDAKLVNNVTCDVQADATLMGGDVMDNGVSYSVSLVIDADQRIQSADCECHFYYANKLRKGPCEHILAVRKANVGITHDF